MKFSVTGIGLDMHSAKSLGRRVIPMLSTAGDGGHQTAQIRVSADTSIARGMTNVAAARNQCGRRRAKVLNGCSSS